MLSYEKQFWNAGFQRILGMDEAGRGPLAGPVCVAGVIFDAQKKIPEGINDSKKLSKTERERLFCEITDVAEYEIVFISPKRIDEVNILNAVKEGMLKIVKKLKPDCLLTDAVNIQYPNIPQLSLIKGDSLSYSIAAASILAKVSRDREMERLAFEYPEYGFEKHAGYPTKDHVEAIQKHGYCPIHRKTFQVKSLQIAVHHDA